MRGYNYKNYLVIGAGELGVDFYETVTKNYELGIRIIGFLDDKKEFNNSRYSEKIKKMILGKTTQIETILKTMSIDNVIVTLPLTEEKHVIEITNICEKYGIKAELVPDYRKIVSSNPSFRIIEDFPLIGIRNVPLENMFNRLIKRLLDLILAIPGLILISPMLFIIMIIIKLTSKGPVFFRQKRTGFQQKEFNIIKFRTMKLNSESDTKQATKDDPRKTKFGEFLRETNIDELPQIINVIKGDMSIVGPRPHMIAHTDEFYKKYDKYMVRHWVKPGITGLAQVNGWRGDSDIKIRVKYDIKYIENWSIWLDLRIIFLTFFSKKTKKNAV
jgi:Undecaprenyl-phosphate glucose phosphotransferase